MELTKNLSLKKPAQEDFYNVDDFNENADILDDEVQKIKNGYVPVKGNYIKDLSVNGDTVTYTKGNDTTGSFKSKTYSKLSEFTNDTGYITKDDTCAGATNDGNGRNIVTTYATKQENADNLATAKAYTDTEKAKYLPLAGGKMSGDIYKNVDNSGLMLAGGSTTSNGASLCLRGKSHTGKGGFFMRANDGSTSIDFAGSPTGSLVWHGKNIVRSVNGTDADVNGNINITVTGGVKTVDGVTPDTNGNVRSRGCIVGQAGATSTNPWYKFASITLPTAYLDEWITFKVTHLFNSVHHAGILTAHVRATSTISKEESRLVWEYASRAIDLSKFVIATNAGNPLIAELWVKIDEPYAHYTFEVLAESTREKRFNDWTLYNTHTVGSCASITSGYTRVASTLDTIKNNINGSSASATNDSNGANIASTYIKSLSVNGRKITYTKGDGTTGTITTQDTNTTYDLSPYVKLATAQTISAQHNFSNGVKVNGYVITVG